jgi:hypothetical protein
VTDLDTLRRALQAPPAAGLGSLHVGQIMARGRRVRRRRRVLTVAGGAAGLAAVVAAAVIVPGAGPAAGPRHLVPALAPGRSAALGRSGPYGSVISTGIRNSAGELVFYAVRVHAAQLPDTTFGIMSGYRKASGKLTADVLDSEFSGPDTAPGFHAVHAPMTVGKEAIPEFGYYAGPAVKITGIVGGRRILADHAQWSVNPKIVIFWFSPRADRFDYAITGLAAYNAHGKRLPTGHSTVGAG